MRLAPKSYEGIFEARGNNYDEAMRRWPDARRNEFATALNWADVRSGDHVCDFPSGGGYIKTYLPAGTRLTQVEKSSTFHDISRGVLAEGNKVPLPDASFDKIVSIAGMHHDNDQRGFFAECARLLKTGGTLCVSDAWAGSRPALFLDSFIEAHAGIFLGEHTLRDIADAGLRIERAEYVSYPWVFDTEEDMAAFCLSLFAVRKSIDETLEILRRDLGVKHEGGKVLLDWGLYFVKAVK